MSGNAAFDMSADDDAAFEAMRDDTSRPAPREIREPEPEAPAPEAPPSEEELTRDTDLSPDEVAKRKDAKVTFGAMHEQRERRKAAERERDDLRRQLEDLRRAPQQAAPQQQPEQQPNPDEIPDPVANPLEALEFLRRAEVERRQQAQETKAETEARQRQEEGNHLFLQAYKQGVDQFKSSDPEGADFDDAYKFAQNHRLTELMTAGWSREEAIQELIQNEAAIVHRAMVAGQNPGKVLLAIAKGRGWAKAAPPEADPDVVADAKIDKVAEARKLGGSMSGTGGAGGSTEMTASKLAKLPPAEFEAWEKKNPKKFVALMGG